MAVGTAAGFALGGAVISGVFAAMVFRQYVGRRKLYQLAWSVGLALFAVNATLEFVAFLRGWDEGLYRAFFALHAPLVALLGLGTVYLMADKRWGHGFLVYILVLTALYLFFSATAPVDAEAFVPGEVVGGRAMPDDVRSLSQLFTFPGAVALIGGALYSWHRTRWGYNLLIAAGAAIMTAGGILARWFTPEPFYTFLLIGIAVMFAGFLRSREVARAPQPRAAPQAVE